MGVGYYFAEIIAKTHQYSPTAVSLAKTTTREMTLHEKIYYKLQAHETRTICTVPRTVLSRRAIRLNGRRSF